MLGSGQHGALREWRSHCALPLACWQRGNERQTTELLHSVVWRVVNLAVAVMAQATSCSVLCHPASGNGCSEGHTFLELTPGRWHQTQRAQCGAAQRLEASRPCSNAASITSISLSRCVAADLECAHRHSPVMCLTVLQAGNARSCITGPESPPPPLRACFCPSLC